LYIKRCLEKDALENKILAYEKNKLEDEIRLA
jgi:hypothetical protein